MKRLLFPLAALVLALGVAVPAMADVTVPLWAGNGAINVGSVTVSDDGTSLTVMFQVSGGWELTETHVAVGESLGDIPQGKSGNPKIGHFGYSSEHDPGVTTVTHTIPLDGLEGTIVIAAHAVVVYEPGGCIPPEETAWAVRCVNAPLGFPGNSWATYFYYTVQVVP